MVNRVVPLDDLRSATRSLAAEIATKHPFALRQAKRAVNQTLDVQGFYAAIQSVFDIHQTGHGHAISESGVWGISILGADQRPVADWLSTQGRPLHGQLDRIPHRRGPVTGVALLQEALATLELRTTAIHPAGDHSIVVGEVVSLSSTEHPADALVYYRSRYQALR